LGRNCKINFSTRRRTKPGGASYMIRDGALENPKPQGIIGLHVHPGLNIGKLSFRKGRVMASADEIYITIKSKGSNAAAPFNSRYSFNCISFNCFLTTNYFKK
jgi:hippurate hydrolase